jgi:16S rRNA (guanine966-N2)-methyltransferase
VRVIGGNIKGRRLGTCRAPLLRPTSDKVREAVFDIIAPLLDGGAVLDLFAGTGSLGIEALSRGMDRAVFVENNSQVCEVLRKNLLACGVENQAEVISVPVDAALRLLRARGEAFRLIFLDPPYQGALAGKILREVSETRVLEKDGLAIAEHSSREEMKSVYGNLILDDRRRYGHTVVSFYVSSPGSHT